MVKICFIISHQVFNIDFSKDDSEVFGKNHNFFTPVHSRDVSQPGTELRVGLTSAMKVTPAAPPGSLTDTETPLVVHRSVVCSWSHVPTNTSISNYCETGYFSGHVIFAVDILSVKIKDRVSIEIKYMTVKQKN